MLPRHVVLFQILTPAFLSTKIRSCPCLSRFFTARSRLWFAFWKRTGFARLSCSQSLHKHGTQIPYVPSTRTLIPCSSNQVVLLQTDLVCQVAHPQRESKASFGQSSRHFLWGTTTVTVMCKHDRFFDKSVLAVYLLLAAGGPPMGCEASYSFGINYGKVANNLPAPAEVVGIIQSLSITKAKLYDPDPLVLSTFQNTNISFLVGVRNEDLRSLTDQAAASAWIQQNVLAFHPATNIIGVVVGNEIFSGTDAAQMSALLPAMRTIHAALRSNGLKMIVSTTHSFGVLSSSFPPSAGRFDPAIANTYMKPILKFLTQTGSPFMINVYPFFAYEQNSATVSLEYVLFEPNAGSDDDGTGLHYTNMFDAQLDAVYSAMAALGFKNVSLLVSETGWPSSGDAAEPGATIQNAQLYHNNLYKHLNSTHGTPLRSNTPFDVYLFALFNENLKSGPTSERNFGLFYPRGERVYELDFAPSSSSPPSYFPRQASTKAFVACGLLLTAAMFVG